MAIVFNRREISLCRSPSCQTLSKARSMPRRTAIVHSLRLECRVVSVCSSRMGFIVERCGRKPNCCWGMMLSVSRMVLRQLLRIFSRIFPMICRREMGRYDRGLCGSFPGLGIIMVEAVFQVLGKYEALRQLSRIMSRAWHAGSGNCLRMMGFILSGPGALVFLSCLM